MSQVFFDFCIVMVFLMSAMSIVLSVETTRINVQIARDIRAMTKKSEDKDGR